jgi:hypothetical protein
MKHRLALSSHSRFRAIAEMEGKVARPLEPKTEKLRLRMMRHNDVVSWIFGWVEVDRD